ncbi:MAG: hypothetical protein ACI9C4_002106 [Paraglaciecola sp.]|jgi:hypothetical protein
MLPNITTINAEKFIAIISFAVMGIYPHYYAPGNSLNAEQKQHKPVSKPTNILSLQH